MKIWIVVEIDNYGGDGDDVPMFTANYVGIKVCKTEEEMKKEVRKIQSSYASSAEVEVVEI